MSNSVPKVLKGRPFYDQQRLQRNGFKKATQMKDFDRGKLATTFPDKTERKLFLMMVSMEIAT